MSEEPEMLSLLKQEFKDEPIRRYEPGEIIFPSVSHVHYIREDLCIPLPTLPDEMEDGYVVMENNGVTLFVSGRTTFAVYLLERAVDGKLWCTALTPNVYQLLNLPDLSQYEVQGNKIVRKG